MKATLIALFLVLAVLPAEAACYADYKAKRDNPLRLHYGVIELSDAQCNPAAAAAALRARLAGGWQLLQVVGVFGPEGLDSRRNSAGPFFLRF